MNEQETFDFWAPRSSPWSPWVKPVLFTQLEHAYPGPANAIPNDISWDNAPDLAAERLAIVLDLPGETAVSLGLRLTGAGFRPVPLFNTSFGPNAVVPVQDMITALRRGSEFLAGISDQLPPDGPPAFLLDSNRMHELGEVLPGKYDNRWLVFPQDFPSAKFLQAQRITGVMLVQNLIRQPQDDLAHVLLRWQEAGIPILSATLADNLRAEATRVVKPPRYRRLWYQFLAVLGLRRNGAGGFGAMVPEPSGGGFG